MGLTGITAPAKPALVRFLITTAPTVFGWSDAPITASEVGRSRRSRFLIVIGSSSGLAAFARGLVGVAIWRSSVTPTLTSVKLGDATRQNHRAVSADRWRRPASSACNPPTENDD